MANSSVSDQVRARVESFVGELSELIRRSAMETVQQALAGGDAPRRGRRGAGAAAAGRRGGAVAKAPRGGRAKGAKRSPDELEKLTGQLLTYIKGNAGQRIEQIADGMGTSTKELNLPAKKLLSTKAIKTKGHKRATQYFPK
ncbi:MAG TPA: DNA-binding protein [Polyangiaceae bacterium]|nr:DNA-binding protein [Polyangiaceae bacterium]